jgi:hypothetical protein
MTERLTTHQRAAATILAFEHGLAPLDHLMANSGTGRRTWQALADRGLILLTSDDVVLDIRLGWLVENGHAR